MAGADNETFFHLRQNDSLLEQRLVDDFTEAKTTEPKTIQIIEEIIAPLGVGYFVDAIARFSEFERGSSVQRCLKNRFFDKTRIILYG